MLRPVFLTGLSLALSACAPLPPERPVAPQPARIAAPERPATLLPARITLAEPASHALVTELARVAGLSPEQRRRELTDLDGSRLDDERRFQLAALLEREDNADSLERSLKLLSALGDLDVRSQALVDQMKKSLRARLENKQLAARNAELQGKLEQIKALEKSLQQRSAPKKSP